VLFRVKIDAQLKDVGWDARDNVSIIGDLRCQGALLAVHWKCACGYTTGLN